MDEEEIYVPILFINDEGDRMQFYLIIRNEKKKDDLRKTIKSGLGSVAIDRKSYNPHTIILLDEECSEDINEYLNDKDLKIPAFKSSYIMECMNAEDILPLLPFLVQKPTVPCNASYSLLDVVFEKKYTWEQYADRCRQDAGLGVPVEKKTKFSSSESESTEEESSEMMGKNTKRLRVPAMSDEEHNIKSTTSDFRIQKKAVTKKLGVPVGKKTKFSSSESESTEEESSVEMMGKNWKRLRVPATSDEESSKGEDTRLQLMKRNVKPFGHSKRTHSPYLKSEKEAILRYIVENGVYERVKGNRLWYEMEEANVCPIRTWASMKEHFRKVLVNELHSFSFLTAEQKRKIRTSK